MRSNRNLPEPNYREACAWWPDITDYVTPVGWKDHMFRFNVLFNGTILAQPAPRLIYAPFKRFAQWEDQGVQLNFPYLEAFHWWEHFGRGDDRMTRQGWRDRPAPVLWSQWPKYGIMVRQEVFAYIPGAEEVQTGIEPLFLWVRMSFADRMPAIQPALPPHGRCCIHVRINRPHIIPTMERRLNLLHDWTRSRYPRALQAPATSDVGNGFALTEPDGKIRLAVAPTRDCLIQFMDGKPTANDYLLQLWLKPEVGERVDLLVPMLPCAPAVFNAALHEGYDAALRAADRYWRRTPATAARIDVPEEPINRTITQTMKTAFVVAEKNPADGRYTLLTSSCGYPMMWSTQLASEMAMTLDPLGYHAEVAKYLEIFRAFQGQSKPPSRFIPLHPGFLAPPRDRTSIPWLTDHGALLHTVCRHIQLTADPDFIQRWLEPVIKACEFIKEVRQIRGHGGIEGLVPPGSASDQDAPIQAVWTDGWYYRGYLSAIHVLRKLNHLRAEEFAADARNYKRVFVAAFRQAARRMPVWTDARGRRHRLAPMSLFEQTVAAPAPSEFNCADESGQFGTRMTEEPRHPFYLDTGPLFLVFAGLLEADDPLMKSTCLWFREGPPHRHYRRDASHWQVPALDHEMSSVEPYFSWNIFHSHQLKDRRRFLEGMYSQFAGALSRQTFSFVEERGSQSGLGPELQCFLMARLAVIDDQVREEELHLLRLVPLAWLSRMRSTLFDNMPTVFGPVSLRFGLSRDGRILRVQFKPRFRESPKRVILHIPPAPGLRQVTVNGKLIGWIDRRTNRFDLH
jgi:hypothetical protein